VKLLDDLAVALGVTERAETSTPALFAEFLRGSLTASGVQVTPRKALQISGFWSATCILSEAVGSLPLIVYRRLPNDRGKERAIDHPLYRVLRSRASRRHTAAEFRSLMQADVEAYGNALARKVTINGQVRELLPIQWSRVADVVELSDGALKYVVRRPNYGDTFDLRDDQVVHLRGPGGDGIRGACIVEEFKELFGLAYALEMYLAYTLKNAGRVGGVLSPKTGSVGDKAWERLKDWLGKDHAGIENAGKWLIVPESLEFQKGTMNFEEAQVADVDDKILARIGRVTRMPLHMLGSNIAQPRANMEQQGREFVDLSLRGRLKRWEEGFNAAFFDDGEEYFCEFLLDDLLRGDAATRAIVYRAMVELGIFTRNEVRERENMNKLDGLDEPLTPLNMGTGNAGVSPGTAALLEGAATKALLEEFLAERRGLARSNGHAR